MTHPSDDVVLRGRYPGSRVTLPPGADIVAMVDTLFRLAQPELDEDTSYGVVEEATGWSRDVVAALWFQAFASLHARVTGFSCWDVDGVVEDAVAARASADPVLVMRYFPPVATFPELPADLPPGALTAEPWFGAVGAGLADARAWVTSAPPADLAGAYARLLADAGRSGLHPVVVDFTAQDPCPWGARDTQVELLDAESALAAIRTQHAEAFGGSLALGEHRELARGSTAPVESAPDRTALDLVRSLVTPGGAAGPYGLALVPARRGADVLAATGWTGAANHTATPAQLSAVLRSWEERFGARLVLLSSSRIGLSVANPPTDVEQATALAREHLAFCPDTVFAGYDSEDEYAHQLVGQEMWVFWWD
ncbi:MULTISPECIES: DUF4253 domain-containing protein [unclassified Isoptericola]|uniref:DUF4253 domain-containing protein n=1 Tax=unclassified Isoptericola TaxID=2623355 RepID=UPI00365EC134